MDSERTEFERRVLEDIRFLRRTVLGLSIVFGLILLGVVGLGLAGVVVQGSDGEDESRGNDVHAAFTPGTTAETLTEAGKRVRATITEFTWKQGPVFIARIKGGEPRSLEADAWTFVLHNGTVLALSREQVGDNTYRFWLEGSLPGGASVRFIHFDPDDSHGDIYFDVK